MSPCRTAYYSAVDACRAAGITYRQLDYWDRVGVVSPSVPARGSGVARGYTLDEVVALRLLAAVGTSGYTRLPSGAVDAVRTRARFVVTEPDPEEGRSHFRPIDDLDVLLDVVCHSGGVTTIVDVVMLWNEVIDALDPGEDETR